MRFIRFLKLGNGFWPIFVIASLITILLQFSYSYVPQFAGYLINMLKNEVQSTSLPSFVIDMFESGSGILDKALIIVSLLFGFQLTRYILLFLEALFRSLMLNGVSRKLRIRLYDHIQNLSFSYHKNVDTGDLIQRVTSDVDWISGFISGGLGHFIYLISVITFGAYQMFFINQTMMIVALITLPLVAIASIFYFNKIDKLNDNIEKSESEMTVVIQENLSASKVVKAFSNERFEIDKMDEKSQKYRDNIKKENRISAIYWGSMDSLGLLEYLIIVIIGVLAVQNGIMNMGDVVKAFLTIGMLIWPIRGMGREVKNFTKSLVASERLYEVLKLKSEYVTNGTLAPDIKGNIEFKNVSFKFSDADEELLKGISFSINQGETVAFVGKTGCGKTTIVNLLLRMYDYSGGSILMDGTELKDIDKQYVRNQIGSVLQDPFLYSKSVFQNIAITKPNATKEEVERAAQIASLAREIDTFQSGYETLVGEKGTMLSGGQKQRVAIARVLVADKPILIFDDALSAVDTNTDISIRNALKEKEGLTTNIIITHRITTAKEADKIIVLSGGKIEAIGTHEELKNKPGLYQNLWNIQGKLESEFLAMIEGDLHV